MENIENAAVNTQEEREAKNREIILGMISRGELPPARAMTRAERKSLDKTSFNIGKYKPNDTFSFGDAAESMYDWILTNIYNAFDFETKPNNVGNAFALYTYKLTYQDELSEKN